MKSILAVLLVSVLSAPWAGHAFGPDEFARLARDRMAAIRATPNRGIPAGADCRYVSATGDDAADGRTPSSAWRTLERLSQEKLPPGAFVLLERGGLYRGTIQARAGVTYTAYGEGPKPVVCGSPEDGANPSKWRRTESPKVWAYEIGHRDVGTLVFDGGATHAVKVLIRTEAKTGRRTDLRTGRPFESFRDLDRDLDFWHDYSEDGTGLLYLCSETNPGVRFKSIEFSVKRNGVSVRGNADVTVDNLCIRCVGGHGVGAGTCRNLTVSNCEFAWIGGSIQGEGMFGRDHPTRFGNGVEVYGGCDGYVVSNCVIRQVYDAAVTHQYNIRVSDGMKRFDQRHVRYVGNVIGRCNYSVEYFLTAPNGNPSSMEDVVVEDNLMFDAGVGFCEQRPDRGVAAHVKGDWRKDRNRARAFVFRDNVMCRTRDAILRVGSGLRNADGSSSLPRFERNVLLSTSDAFFGYVSEEPSSLLPFGPEAQAVVDRLGSGNRCEVIEDVRQSARPPLDGARWIADPGSRNPAFAKAFAPRAKVASATLAVTGVGWYEAFLNGRKIGDKVLDPTPTQYDRRVLYSTYDVTGLLADGGNELRILLGNGLYNVQEKCEWGFDRAPWRADPAAIATLVFRYADGTAERIATDESWRVVPSPVLFNGFREGEVVLAEPRMDGAPRAATVVAGPKGRLELETAPAAKVVRDVPVEKTETLADGSTVYRMAENMAGWARIRFTGLGNGDVVTIRYDERHPDEGNRLIDRFCRSLPSTNACPELAAETAGFQIDRFVSAGGAEEFYEPRFSYNGFRYVTVKGATPAAKDVIGRFVRTSFPKTGSFACDDAGFMKVMEATARAYESNFTDGFPTDCPHREKNGWLGDAAVAIPYAALEWGSAANTCSYRNWIRSIADGQADDGRISSIAPHSGHFHFDGHACAGGPAWGVALTTVPMTLYRYRRDPEILSEAYPAMKRYVMKLLSERNGEGIVNYGLGDWCAVSWEWSKDRNFRTSLGLTSTAYAYCSLRETAAAAKLLGYAADAERFETGAAKLRRAFNAKFYRGGGRYDKNASPTAQATALELGLVEPAEIPAVRARLVEAVHEMDDKIDFGIIGSRTVFRQLCEAGAVDLAWKLIMRPDYPSYLNMVSQDVNTLMETFSGNCSRNHIMFGDVGAWAYEYLAGIRVGTGDACAGLAVTVRPFVPKALNHVRASVGLAEGRMTVEWTKKDGVFALLLDIPNGVGATVVMPDGKVRTAHARHQEWSCPMPGGGSVL